MSINTIEHAAEFFEAALESKQGVRLTLPLAEAHALRSKLYTLRKKILLQESRATEVPLDYVKHPYKEVLIKLEKKNDGTAVLTFVRANPTAYALLDIATNSFVTRATKAPDYGIPTSPDDKPDTTDECLDE